MDERGPDLDVESEPARFQEPDAAQRDPALEPHGSLWLVYLVFRPRRFFETFVHRSLPTLTQLSAWMYGIASVMDRMEARILLSPRASPLYETLRQRLGDVFQRRHLVSLAIREGVDDKELGSVVELLAGPEINVNTLPRRFRRSPRG